LFFDLVDMHRLIPNIKEDIEFLIVSNVKKFEIPLQVVNRTYNTKT
jgi:hypothetical protein